MTTTTVKPADLQPGDMFLYQRFDASVSITVLGAPQDHEDMFGRDELKIWCKRDDTGAEGWMTYGFGAGIELMNR